MIVLLNRASNNQPVSLTKQIADSGEGEVWETNQSGYLAKIYHDPTPARIEKLKVMLANPPADPMLRYNHVSIAWVSDLLKDSSGKYLGFLMPAIRDSKQLSSVYNPRRRKRVAPGFNWYYLHVTALNTAWIIQEIHAKGYVLGDIKLENILVNNRAMVAVIDTDSFQVRDSQSNKVYPCTVGSEGFTPPELLGKDFDTTNQTEIHDRFRLGVLIHYLLFGYHPFSGQWTGIGESPEQTELIRQGYWYAAHNSPIRESRTTIPLDVVHPKLKKLFLQCFNDGHTQPHLRPTAQDWHNALEVGVDQLTVCGTVDSHHYSRHYGKCYWCERAANLGVDIFPGVASAAKIHPNPIQTAPVSKSSNQTLKQPTSLPHTVTKPTSQTSLPLKQVTNKLAHTLQSTINFATSRLGKISLKKKLLIGGTGAISLLLLVTQIYGFITYRLSPFSQIFLITSLRSKILLKYTLKGIASPVAITPDGKTLVSSEGKGNYDTFLKVWNLQTGDLKYKLTGLNHKPGDIAISSNGQTLVSGGDNDDTNFTYLKVWNLNTGELRYALSDRRHYLSSVIISPDGRTVVSGGSSLIKIWNLNTEKLNGGSLVRSLAISPDGKTLVSVDGGYQGKPATIKIWDLETGELKHTLKSHIIRDSRLLAISPDGKTLVSCGRWDKQKEKYAAIKIWDLETGKLKHTLIGHKDVDSLAISSDGKTLISANEFSFPSVKIWRMP